MNKHRCPNCGKYVDIEEGFALSHPDNIEVLDNGELEFTEHEAFCDELCADTLFIKLGRKDLLDKINNS